MRRDRQPDSNYYCLISVDQAIKTDLNAMRDVNSAAL